jgi:hypothetical protein
MVLALFGVSLVLAFAISAIVAWASKDVIEGILHRFLADKIGTAISKYLRFAIVIAGISDGTRAGILRDFIYTPSINRDALSAQLTQEFWALELYRTVIGSLEGILRLMLIFSLGTIVAIVLIRRANLTDLLPHEE